MTENGIQITFRFGDSILRKQREALLHHVGNSLGDQVEEWITEAVEENNIKGLVEFEVFAIVEDKTLETLRELVAAIEPLNVRGMKVEQLDTKLVAAMTKARTLIQ